MKSQNAVNIAQESAENANITLLSPSRYQKMPYIATTATKKLLKLKQRIRVVAGGTSAGKTIAILEILIDYAQSNKGKLISVVSD